MAQISSSKVDGMLIPLDEVAVHSKCDKKLLQELASTSLSKYSKRIAGKGVHFRWSDLEAINAIIRQTIQAQRRKPKVGMPQVRDGNPYLRVTDVAILLGVHPHLVRTMLKQRLCGRDEVARDILWAIISDGMALYRDEKRLQAIVRKNIPRVIKEAVATRDQNLCRYCGVTLTRWKRVFDHVIPVVQKGPNTVENLVQACRACNHKKFDRTPEQAGMPLLVPGTTRQSRRRAA